MIKVEKTFDGKYELTNTINGITYYFGQFNNMDQINFEIDYRNKTGWEIHPPERLKWNHLPRYIYYHKNKKKLRVDKWELIEPVIMEHITHLMKH